MERKKKNQEKMKKRNQETAERNRERKRKKRNQETVERNRERKRKMILMKKIRMIQIMIKTAKVTKKVTRKT